MYGFLYFFIVLTAILIAVFLLYKLRQKTTNELEKILYISNNPLLYLELLKNPRLKVLYRKSTLLQFELNAYLLTGDDQRIDKTIGALNIITMTKGENLEFQQKKLSYYCSKNDRANAKDSLDKIEEILVGTKGKQTDIILEESRMIYNIYIVRDTGLIQQLEKAKDNQKGAVKGLTLYRLAKLSYFGNDIRKTQMYLKQAQELLKNTAWDNVVELAVNDVTVLNYK